MANDHVTALLKTIESVSQRIQKYSDRRLGEQNTKASLIEPVIEALGWDIRDPDEVHREFKPTSKDCPVDYSLKLLRKPRLFVEAKGLGEDLSDRKWVSQVLSYATVAGVEWCVLTDGNEYRFYNASAAVDAEEKLFCRLRLTESSANDAARMLGLISRRNLEENLLDVLWSAHFVDRRVKDALRTMIETCDRRLIRLIRQHVSKLSPKEIADSIRRLDISIELTSARMDAWSSPTAKIIDTPAPVQRIKSAAKRPSREIALKAWKTRREQGNIGLEKIISAGILPVPLTLFVRYKKQRFEATLNQDGQVEFDGTMYPTCSAAGSAAREKVAGRPMATNGWEFWRYRDVNDVVRTLDDARQDYLKQAK